MDSFTLAVSLWLLREICTLYPIATLDVKETDGKKKNTNKILNATGQLIFKTYKFPIFTEYFTFAGYLHLFWQSAIKHVSMVATQNAEIILTTF